VRVARGTPQLKAGDPAEDDQRFIKLGIDLVLCLSRDQNSSTQAHLLG